MESKPVEDKDGIRWKLPDGTLHRLDGPAVEYGGGTTSWFFHGKRHRLDGPALLWISGIEDWFINGCDVTNEITSWTKELGIDLNNLSEDDKILIQIKWSDYGNIP